MVRKDKSIEKAKSQNFSFKNREFSDFPKQTKIYPFLDSKYFSEKKQELQKIVLKTAKNMAQEIKSK